MSINIRPRAIDQDRELLVVKDINDLEDDLTSVPSRIAPDIATGMDAEDEKEVHVRRAMEGQFGGGQKLEDIPTPQVRHIENWKQYSPADFKRPAAYIHYTEKSWDEPGARIDYDMDSEDEKWLDTFNGGVAGKALTADQFELIVDRLEKGTNYSKELRETIELPSRVGEKTFNAVREHWAKRRNARGMAFNINFRPRPEFGDTNPRLAFRPRERYHPRRHRGNDLPSYEKLKRLRRDFETARRLLALLKKREELKRGLATTKQEIFERLQVEDKNPALFALAFDLPNRQPLRRISQVYDAMEFESQEAGYSSEGTGDLDADVDSTFSEDIDYEDVNINLPGLSVGYAKQAANVVGAGSPMLLIPPNFVDHRFDAPKHFLQPPSAPRIVEAGAGVGTGAAAGAGATATPMEEDLVKPLVDIAHVNPKPRASELRLNSESGVFRFRGRPRYARGGRIVYDRLPLSVAPKPPAPRPTLAHRGLAAAAIARKEQRESGGPMDVDDPFGLGRLHPIPPSSDAFAEFKAFLKSIPLGVPAATA